MKSSDKNESKAARRLQNLIEVNQHFAGIEKLEELFPLMLELAKEVIGAEAASLLLYNPDKNVLEFVSITDDSLDLEKKTYLRETVKIKIGEGIAGRVAKSRLPINVADAQRDSRFLKSVDRDTGFMTRTILSVPLVHNNKLLGVLNVLNSIKSKRFDDEDQEILLAYSNLASVAIVRAKLIESRLAQQRLETQMSTAAKIQELFWPEIPDLAFGSHVWAVSRPAAFVGGDLYDFIPLQDGSWVFYVADVSDKGLPAAMIMVALWSEIRSEILLHSDVGRLLGAINNVMYKLLNSEGFFATIVLGRYWPKSGKINLVRGGHLFPLLISDGGVEAISSLEGVALGVVEDARYDACDISLCPGDSIIFFSDGVVEAENKRGVQFSSDRVVECMKNERYPPRSKILFHQVLRWQEQTNLTDDLTLLEIWRDPP